MRFFIFSVLAIAVVFGFSTSAHADYVVWQDSKTGVSLSWPDDWQIVSSADPDDVVTIMAPSGRAHAACRVRVREDRRYMIYPASFSQDVQRAAYSFAFWNRYFEEYTDPEIYNMRDGAGLGLGFSGYALAGYTSAVQGPEMRRRALVFASLYNGKAYILECSAHEDAFAQWKGPFLSIAKSVGFKKAYHELRTGNLPPPNFLADPYIEFKGDEGENRVLY